MDGIKGLETDYCRLGRLSPLAYLGRAQIYFCAFFIFASTDRASMIALFPI